MQGKRYEALDGAPVTTTDGALTVMPMGVAVVHHSSDGFSIAVGDMDPIVVSAGEFERLVAEGQLHGLPIGPAVDESASWKIAASSG
jgi:hypothetical protein